ncbi:MAG: RNA polymerase sigma factor [Bacteroidia bacterium]|nr:RNA polymerase sigma factor [Bacteroidia bacterium]
MKVIQLHQNEKQLIKRAGENSREAQRLIYERFSPKMLSVCRYYINDIREAEEVMLNGFFKVFTNIKSFRHKGSFEGWIRRIMIRESISFLRGKKQVYFNSEITEQIPDQTTDDVEIDLEAIQELIDELPEGYRMVFLLYAIEGYKHREIAEMLSISENTSKSQLFKARKILQKNFKNLNKKRHGTP